MSSSRSSVGNRNESSEHIVQVREDDDVRGDNGGGGAGADVLEGVKVPAEFDDRVFDAAFRSVRFMVWSETWQRYMQWRRSSGEGTAD